ncbi:MAG: S49 family peptidase [Chloroflexi bacterium]|nr:MAG: S49 family peptidase [Chloroflexota bacterium]
MTMSDAQGTNTAAPPTESRSSNEQTIVIFVLVIIGALIAGYYLSTTLIPKPKIGIINLQTQVGERLEEAMTEEINYARNADDIKAVVLLINSPGGSASAGHDIYYQVRKLRNEKPVIASMDGLAASAAYQIGVAANEIYAKPASLVGNVGVIMGQPQPETLSERFTTTGPFKATGGSATAFLQKLDLLHADFRDSVVAERSQAPNPLKLLPDQVATGEIWIGIEAKDYGLIDEIGSTLDAIDRAAELAGLDNYDVVQVRDEYLASLEGSRLQSALKTYEALDAEPEFDLSSESQNWPSFYQLYIPLE